MADPNNVAQYKYSAMSNLVLQADRRFVTRRADEVTGDPESLAGRLSIKDMGVHAMRPEVKQKNASAPKDIERGGIREGADVLKREQRKRKRGEQAQLRGVGILSAADALIEGLKYRPRTAATRATYDLILTTTASHLGDVPHDVIRSAADAILELLKDENMKDFDKKKEVDDLLGVTMGPKEFNELVNLGKKITDYDAQDDDETNGAGAEGEDGAELDERQGVAVVFDESDEDEDEMRPDAEVKDEGESSEDEDMSDEGPADEGEAAQNIPEDVMGMGDEDMIIDAGAGVAAGKSDADTKIVPAREIDAYWLQRQIGNIYSDAHVQHEKAQEAFTLMSEQSEDDTPKPLRDVENDLMELFDYDHPELVGTLVLNRDRIVWTTRWRREAEDSDARRLIENQMIESGNRLLLDELTGKVQDATERPGKKMKVDSMDVDTPMAKKEEEDEAKPRTMVGGLPPSKVINLENLVFDQGNHLMTNPNVKLPQGSTKRTFKGYEEIHVPAPKPRRDDDIRRIPITELPEWSRPGFGNTDKFLL